MICLVEYETRADFELRRYLRKSSWRGTKRILEAECCWSGTSCGIFNRYKGVTFQITSLSSLQHEEQGTCSSHSGIFCVVRNSDSNDYWKFLLQHLEKDRYSNNPNWVFSVSVFHIRFRAGSVHRWEGAGIDTQIVNCLPFRYFLCVWAVSSVGRAWCW